MHVGQHGYAHAFPHLGQNGQSFGHAHAAKRRPGRTVGLVEAGLVKERHSRLRKDFLECGGNFQRVGATLQRARSGDAEQGRAIVHRPEGFALKIKNKSHKFLL